MLHAYCVPSPVLGAGDIALHEAGKSLAVCGAYHGTDKAEIVRCDVYYKGNETG